MVSISRDSLIFMQRQIFSIMFRSEDCAGQLNFEIPFSVFQILVCLDELGVALSSWKINGLLYSSLNLILILPG